jgi:DNA-binding Xre family transcriptional regulator
MLEGREAGANGKPVSLTVIDRLCAALDCQPGDIVEYVPDKE